MTLMARGHTSKYSLDHFMRHIPQIRPVGVAFFKGNLHLEELTWRHRVVMRLAMYLMPEIRPGHYLNADEVRTWSREAVLHRLAGESPPVSGLPDSSELRTGRRS
jgi:menaquinone-dependent protoporphyrinogen IX oxidase